MTYKAKRVSRRMPRFTSDGREAGGIGIAEYAIYDLPPRPGQTGWVGTIYETSAKKAVALYRQQLQGKTE